jgi:hypothetical protein
MYWTKNSPTSGCLAVAEAMSKNRFQEIKSRLHLADNAETDLSDRLFKVRAYLDLINQNLQQFGIFAEYLSIDEEMVPYYGNHSLKMCMLNKPIRFGYKLWLLCSADGYPFRFTVYMGKVIRVSIE